MEEETENSDVMEKMLEKVMPKNIDMEKKIKEILE